MFGYTVQLGDEPVSAVRLASADDPQGRGAGPPQAAHALQLSIMATASSPPSRASPQYACVPCLCVCPHQPASTAVWGRCLTLLVLTSIRHFVSPQLPLSPTRRCLATQNLSSSNSSHASRPAQTPSCLPGPVVPPGFQVLL